MTWLVTGGAGYIGSHVVRAFTADGIPAVVIDDLSSGHRSFVRDDVPSYVGSVLQRELLDQIFTDHTIAGVVASRRLQVRRASRSAGRCTPTPKTSPA